MSIRHDYYKIVEKRFIDLCNKKQKEIEEFSLAVDLLCAKYGFNKCSLRGNSLTETGLRLVAFCDPNYKEYALETHTEENLAKFRKFRYDKTFLAYRPKLQNNPEGKEILKEINSMILPGVKDILNELGIQPASEPYFYGYPRVYYTHKILSIPRRDIDAPVTTPPEGCEYIQEHEALRILKGEKNT